MCVGMCTMVHVVVGRQLSCIDPPWESRVLPVAQAGPKLVLILLPQPLEAYDHR